MVSRLESGKNRAEELVEAAIAARDNAYAPYSGFKVGAAILGGSGNIFRGCNVENVSFGLTICAERVAIGNAIAAGETEIIAVAVVAGGGTDPVRPCGGCLQVISEFSPSGDPVAIIAAKTDGTFDIKPLTDYLPIQFSFKSGGNS